MFSFKASEPAERQFVSYVPVSLIFREAKKFEKKNSRTQRIYSRFESTGFETLREEARVKSDLINRFENEARNNRGGGGLISRAF